LDDADNVAGDQEKEREQGGGNATSKAAATR